MKNQASVFQTVHLAVGKTIGAVAAIFAMIAVAPATVHATTTNYTSSGSFKWTNSANAVSAQIECWGGGGGGGGCATNPTYTCAGGGAGGSYVRYTVLITPGAIYNLTVGTAGSAGQTGATGATGGPSYFGNPTAGSSNGAVALAVGGKGGTGNTNLTSGTNNNRTGNVAGGIASSAGNLPTSGVFLSYAGVSGDTSVGGPTNGVAHSGAGGAAGGSSGPGSGGAGGAAVIAGANSGVGVAGTAPGGGGSGSVNTTSAAGGGAGAIGRVAITYLVAPAVTTVSSSNISTIAAALIGNVTADNGSFIIDRGFYWKTSPGVTNTDNQLSEGGTNLFSFSAPLTGLAANTTYYFRAYASNSIGLTLGSELNFTTAPNTPTAPTVNNPRWGSLDVTLGSGDGNLSTTVYAIQETTTGNYVQADGTLGGTAVYQTAATWNPAGAPVTVSGLASSTTYTFQVTAHNGTSNDSGFSPGVSGTTGVPAVPDIISQNATSITTTGAQLNGKITGDGNSTITERGFYWKTSPGVTTGDTQIIEGGTATGSFFSGLSGLSVNTPYYYRAYAVNGIGASIGGEITVWTLANAPLRAVVNNATTNSLNVTLTGGDGNPAGTTYAIEDAYSENYVQADGTLAASAVYQTIAVWNPGGAAVTVSGLSPGSTYTFRVKARNGAGTDTAFSPPASGTCSAASITTNTAPTVTVISAVQRTGTTFMDIDFRVDDPDNATVQVAALGFVNGGASLSDIIKVTTLAEGTSTNLGTNVPANTQLHLTWNVAADWNTNFGNVQVEILAKDNRSLLPFHWITLPANGTNSHLTISDRSYSDADFLPVWYWLLGMNDTGIILSNGIISGVGGSFDGYQLAADTATTTFGRLYLGSKIGFQPVTQSDVDVAGAGPYGNQTIFQSLDLNSLKKGYAPTNFNVVYSWGASSSGQLNFPADVSSMDLRTVALGTLYTLLLNGTSIVGFGDNSLGQISIPASATNVIAISAGYSNAMALRADGNVVVWGSTSSSATNVPASVTNVVAIAAGAGHCLALRANGSVVGWGLNSSGQTTIPSSATAVTAISAGNSHSLALRSDGTVIAWGTGTATNIPPAATNVVAISAGGLHNLALRADGNVVAWGSNSFGQTNVPPSATNVVAISAGSSHSLALRSDGTVIAWGANGQGQTTLPANVSKVTFLGVGENANDGVAVSIFHP